jgi:ABC-type microcin C transport system permease subunit YejB
MQSRWLETEAQATIHSYAQGQIGLDLALRVYTARLLGRESRLVLHGGGNASVKTARLDLLGKEVEVLCVKGSGWDMAEIEPAGFPALRLNRLPDIVLGNVTLFVYSLPTFWLGLILLLLFGEKLRLFPVGGASDPILCPLVDSFYCLADRLWHMVLPAATLGLVGAAGTARFQRAAMLEVAQQDFVRTARAKGLPERRVVLRHQLRNALLSFITRFGLTFPFLLTGAVLVETIFAWPGMGRLTVDAILRRDHALVTAAALIASTLVVAGSLIADILLGFADPRIRVHEDAVVAAVTA